MQFCMLSFVIALACYLLNEHMSLPSIDALTDDEPGCVETGLVVQDGRREDPPAKRGVGGLPVKNSRPGATSRHALEARLTRILGSKCRCACLSKSYRSSCFKQFDSTGPLLDLRVELAQLHKMDADVKVGWGGFSLLHLNLDHVWGVIFVSVAHFYFLSCIGIQV